jgi:nitroreductase
MDVQEAIENRRAYRSLAPVEITEELIDDLAHSARLFCSCFNNQPWRYVFIYEPTILKRMHDVLANGNEWARAASMMIAVVSRPELDCQIKEREYYQFDTGMATAALILRATELGLVAHPIAGFSPKKTRPILNIPETMEIITLVIVGKKADHINPCLSDKQVEAEHKRPERKALGQIAFHNSFVKVSGNAIESNT